MRQDSVPGTRFCLYDRTALHAVVGRMAAEIAVLSRGPEDPLLLGILRRGAPLAEMVRARLGTWRRVEPLVDRLQG